MRISDVAKHQYSMNKREEHIPVLRLVEEERLSEHISLSHVSKPRKNVGN